MVDPSQVKAGVDIANDIADAAPKIVDNTINIIKKIESEIGKIQGSKFLDHEGGNIRRHMIAAGNPHIAFYANYIFGSRTFISCLIYDYENNPRGNTYVSPEDSIYKFDDYQIIGEITATGYRAGQGVFRLGNAYQKDHPKWHGILWQDFKRAIKDGVCRFVTLPAVKSNNTLPDTQSNN